MWKKMKRTVCFAPNTIHASVRFKIMNRKRYNASQSQSLKPHLDTSTIILSPRCQSPRGGRILR